jgi:hypothetical protein
MDWTSQPANFVAPTRTPGERTTRNLALKDAFDALIDVASEGERETIRALFEKEVAQDAPRSWMRELRSVFTQDVSKVRPTARASSPRPTGYMQRSRRSARRPSGIPTSSLHPSVRRSCRCFRELCSTRLNRRRWDAPSCPP